MTSEEKTKSSSKASAAKIAKQFLTSQQFGLLIAMSDSFLEKDRWMYRGKPPGIPFLKVGRSVRYELSEALAAFEARGNRSRIELMEAREKNFEPAEQQTRMEF